MNDSNYRYDVRVLEKMVELNERIIQAKTDRLDYTEDSEDSEELRASIFEDRIVNMQLMALICNDGVADKNQYHPFGIYYAVTAKDMGIS